MTLLHICPRDAWLSARAAGEYAADTLATEGFIHLSRRDQVLRPADLRFRGQSGLVLLEIDETRLTAPLAWEPGVPDADVLYPHVYGPIPLAAVVAVHAFPPLPDGSFEIPPGVG
jgi:uncharacterized protein (DUF952 family)